MIREMRGAVQKREKSPREKAEEPNFRMPEGFITWLFCYRYTHIRLSIACELNCIPTVRYYAIGYKSTQKNDLASFGRIF